MITSVSNRQIRNIIRLQTKASVRKGQGLFVVEGIRIVEELPHELAAAVYMSESFCKGGGLRKIEERFSEGVPVEVVSDHVYKTMSDTVAPQGIMALVKMKDISFDIAAGVLAKPCKNTRNGKHTVLVLENVRDPGNMGTIIRTAEGAGISLILVGSECVDIYNPKVVRSTMGSIFRVPTAISGDLKKDIGRLRSMGFLVYGAHLGGKNYFEECNLAENTALIIGSEADGLSDELCAAADGLIKIPLSGAVESLNAAVAAAILMYEAGRNKHMIFLEKSGG